VDVACTTTSGLYRKNKNNNNKKQSMYHHHGSKFLNFQNYIQRKGAWLKKKKAAIRDSKMVRGVVSSDSDPIQCSTGRFEGAELIRNQPGISLEVVLPCGGAIIDSNVSTATTPMVAAAVLSRDVGDGVLRISDTHISSDGGEAERRSEAHHIIDILEDVGMNFKGNGEENVSRIMECEVRDCRELLAWEQRQHFQ
jgi:hypothetical protein